MFCGITSVLLLPFPLKSKPLFNFTRWCQISFRVQYKAPFWHHTVEALKRMRRQTYRRVFLQHLKQILQDLESVRMIQPEDLGLLELKRTVRNKVDRIKCSEADIKCPQDSQNSQAESSEAGRNRLKR